MPKHIRNGKIVGGAIGIARNLFFDKTKKNLLAAENVQDAVDELSEKSNNYLKLVDVERVPFAIDFNEYLEVGTQIIVTRNDVAVNCENIPEPVAGTLIVVDPVSGANKNLDTAYALRLQFYITYTGNIYTRKMENDANGEHMFQSWKGLLNNENVSMIKSGKDAVNLVVGNDANRMCIRINDDGNKGIFDYTNQKWIVYSDSNGKVMIDGIDIQELKAAVDSL